jgi:hypothetical protein
MTAKRGAAVVPYADGYERTAERLLEHAATQRSGERVAYLPFTDWADHDGKDAPGWCTKKAREVLKRADKKRKAFESKAIEREKTRHKKSRHRKA